MSYFFIFIYSVLEGQAYRQLSIKDKRSDGVIGHDPKLPVKAKKGDFYPTQNRSVVAVCIYFQRCFRRKTKSPFHLAISLSSMSKQDFFPLPFLLSILVSNNFFWRTPLGGQTWFPEDVLDTEKRFLRSPSFATEDVSKTLTIVSPLTWPAKRRRPFVCIQRLVGEPLYLVYNIYLVYF